MNKLYQVHMLPSSKNGTSVFFQNKKIPDILQVGDNTVDNPYWQGMHLYFTSDEEIKPTDKNVWYVYGDSDGGSDQIFGIDKYDGGEIPHGYAKIAATTNKELWSKTPIENTSGHFLNKPLPKIPVSFIEKYVNRQGIKEVMLEYEDVKLVTESMGNDELWGERLKLTPNGEVIWLLPEEVVKEQVIRAFMFSAVEKVFTLLNAEQFNEIKMRDEHGTWRGKAFREWFDKNYPQ